MTQYLSLRLVLFYIIGWVDSPMGFFFSHVQIWTTVQAVNLSPQQKGIYISVCICVSKGESVVFPLFSGSQIQENLLYLLKSCLISPGPVWLQNFLILSYSGQNDSLVERTISSHPKRRLFQLLALFKDSFI